MVAGVTTMLNNAPWRAKAQAEVVSFDYRNLPLDLQLGLLRPNKYEIYRDTLVDTVHPTIIRDTVTVTKIKTKYVTRKLAQPDPEPRKADTLYVPVMHLQVPLSKEVLSDSSVIRIHAVDSIIVKTRLPRTFWLGLISLGAR